MNVLVVGAGPAGATTALLLARYGIDVTLVERETSFERVFRGEGLMPLGMDALFQMGLREALESVPYRLVLSWEIWIDGEEAFVVPEPVEELGRRAVRVVSQPALLERVVEEANRYPSFAFERGVHVHDLIYDPTGRVVGAKLETENGSREEKADLVVGCDGRGSLIRTRADLELKLLPEHYDVLWYKLPAPEALREGCSIMIAVAARRHPVICYTSWDERLQYGLVMPKGSLKEIRNKDWVNESVGAAPGWLAEPNTMGVQVGSGPSSKVKKMRPSPPPCNRPPLFRVSQIELGFLLGSLFSQLGLPVKRLDEGLAVLVPLLVVADLPDLPFRKPLCLLHYVLDTQVVIVLQRRNLRAVASCLACSVLATNCSPRFEPSRFLLSVSRFASSLMFSQAFLGR